MSAREGDQTCQLRRFEAIPVGELRDGQGPELFVATRLARSLERVFRQFARVLVAFEGGFAQFLELHVGCVEVERPVVGAAVRHDYADCNGSVQSRAIGKSEMQKQNESSSVRAATTLSPEAASANQERLVEAPQANAVEGSASTDDAAIGDNTAPESRSGRTDGRRRDVKRVPDRSFGPIGEAEMENQRTANESRSAAARTDQDQLVDASAATPPEGSRAQLFPVVEVPVERLVEAGWNPNRLPEKLLAKLRRSIREFGVVENLVARPHPDRPELFEVLSGNQRLRLYRELECARRRWWWLSLMTRRRACWRRR